MSIIGRKSPEQAAARCGIGVGVFAALVFVGGWLLRIDVLRTIIPIWSAMTPLTAVVLILLSCALIWYASRPALAHTAMAVTAFIGLGVLLQYGNELDTGLQAVTDWFARHVGFAELPAPDTATAAMLVVLVLLCYRSRYSRLHDLADVVAVTIGVIALQVLIAYGYHIAFTESLSGFRQIAPHSTISMMVLAFGATTLRPTHGLYAAMRGRAQSALQLRTLLPITLTAFVIIGWLQVLIMRERIHSSEPQLVAWTVVGGVVVMAIMLFVTSADMRMAEALVLRRQHELEEAKRAAEEASAAKSRFMAVMSHELRTPLTAMIGYADLLETGVAGPLSVEAQGYLQRMRASGWNLVGLIDAVLLYAGGTPAAEDTVPVRLDLNEQVRAVARMFEAQLRDKGLALQLDLPREPVLVCSVERKLRLILINLMSNALKFTEAGTVSMRVQVRGPDALVHVSDTGIGIDAEHLQHIWEPFQQVDSSHTRTHGGVGLGLAITRQLAQQLGVRLSVRSTPGEGSTFTMHMARVLEPEQATTQLTGKKVLVVDDEAAVLRIMTRSLSRYGAQAVPAESAHEALRAVQEHGPFDVLVTDVSMPGMNGIQLAERIAGEHPDIPVLFVTGAELDGKDMAEISALGGRLLRKPFDMVELARAVQRAETV